MEKKRKRIQNNDISKGIVLVSGSTQKRVNTTTDQQEKDREQNYLNKPHMLFK